MLIKDLLATFQHPQQDKTIIHKIHPIPKLVYAITISTSTLLTLNPLIITLIITLNIVILTAAKEINKTLKTLKAAAPIIILVAALNYLLTPKPLKNLYTVAYTLRLIALITAIAIPFTTTNPDKMIQAITQLGIPHHYALTFTLALRFLPTLARDLQQIIDAQRARGHELEKGGIKQKIKSLLPILVPLIIIAVRRSQQVAEAIECRAYGAKPKRTSLDKLAITRKDIVFTIIAITPLVVLLLLKILKITAYSILACLL